MFLPSAHSLRAFQRVWSIRPMFSLVPRLLTNTYVGFGYKMILPRSREYQLLIFSWPRVMGWSRLSVLRFHVNRDSHWKTGKSQFASNDVKFAVKTQDEWLTSQNEGCRLFSYFSSIFSSLILHSLFLFWKTPLACPFTCANMKSNWTVQSSRQILVIVKFLPVKSGMQLELINTYAAGIAEVKRMRSF